MKITGSADDHIRHKPRVLGKITESADDHYKVTPILPICDTNIATISTAFTHN